MRSPSTRSCWTAAGRCRSAPTSSGRRFWLLSRRASLAEAVVFPEPWRPAIITTLGGFDDVVSLPVVPPRVWTSSSLTILMTCCAGLRLFATSAPWARSLTRRMKLRATRTLTSASSSATRSSRQTSSISLSVSFPRLRSLWKMPSKRSASVSNMAQASTVVSASSRAARTPRARTRAGRPTTRPPRSASPGSRARPRWRARCRPWRCRRAW